MFGRKNPAATSPWKRDFPLFESRPGLHYLDAAATCQKPRSVLDALDEYYTDQNANVHRGIYGLAEASTTAYESARETVRTFLHAASPAEVVFTSGATMGLNFLAFSWGRKHLSRGDEIVLSAMEHHSVIVPWTELARELGVTVKVAPLTPDGLLDMDAFRTLLSPKTKAVIITAMSNVLGTRVDLHAAGTAAEAVGARVFVDAAQSIVHDPIDVSTLPIDALVFSGHKLYGDFGSGVLWMREELAESLPPYQGGGEMMRSVTWDRIEYQDSPMRFEAGTPNVSGAVALAAGIQYLEDARLNGAAEHEQALLEALLTKLQEVEGVTIYGPRDASLRGPIVSFNVEGIHPHDLATILDEHGVAVRAGFHCAQPLHTLLGVPASARASFGLWNDLKDIDALISGIAEARKTFRAKSA